MGRSICRFWILLLVLLAAAFAVQAEDSAVIGSYETTCSSCGEAVTGEMDLYQHWYSCPSCGTKHTIFHRNYCSDLTSCMDCGAKGVVVLLENLWQSHHGELQCAYKDEKYCHYICMTCGNGIGQQEHAVDCMKPDACLYCKAEAAKIADKEIRHYFRGQPWINVGEYHQQTCRDCGESRSELHSGECDVPNYCDICNTEDVTILPENVAHGKYVNISQGAYYHDYVCSVCGDVEAAEREHWAYCASRTVCADCGQTGLDLPQGQIMHNRYVYENLGDKHQLVCNDCGVTSGAENHTVYCTAPSVCEGCGATGLEVSEDILQHKLTHWEKLDELYHRKVCDHCGDRTPASREEAGYFYQHQTNCYDETQTCIICGTPNVEIPESDRYHTMVYIDLGEMHQEICTRCDYQREPSWHRVACTDPTVCHLCGLTGLEIAEEDIYHDIMSQTFVSTGDRHQSMCMLCGSKDEPTLHGVDCSDLTTCTICGQTGMTLSPEELMLWHVNPRELVENLGTEHRIRCVCGENVKTEPHDVACTAPNVCRFCDADDVTMPTEMQSHSGHTVNLGLQHQYFCDYCDYFEQPETHQVYCSNTGWCNECLVALLDFPPEMYVHLDSCLTYENAGEQHRRTCSDCGAVDLLDHEYNAYNSCSCGSRLEELSGDVNADGAVDMMDARQLLQYLSGEDVFISMTNTDVNDDFERDEADLLLILQHLSGWDVELE